METPAADSKLGSADPRTALRKAEPWERRDSAPFLAIGAPYRGRTPSPCRINIHEPAGRRAGLQPRSWVKDAARAEEQAAVGAGRAAQVSAPPIGLDLVLRVWSGGDCLPARPRRLLAGERRGL